MNATEAGAAFAWDAISKAKGRVPLGTPISRQELEAQGVRAAENTYKVKNKKLHFITAWNAELNRYFSQQPNADEEPAKPAPVINNPATAPAFILVDNYTEEIIAQNDDRAELEKAKKELEDEQGIFIWSIISRQEPPASPAPIQGDRYIVQIAGRCRYCGDEMIVDLDENADISAVLAAIKEASGKCYECNSGENAAEVIARLSNWLDQIGDGE